jgi:hypothetical protein
MTVISTIISGYCTAHASDSFLTQPRSDGNYEVRDSQTSKILCVRRWAGIISYWGLSAKPEFKWSAVNWLQARITQSDQFTTAEDFARDLGSRLNHELSKMTYVTPTERGIGIHFTAYELVDGYSIPELFAITNFIDTTYQAIRPEGINVTRETYGLAFDVSDRGPQDGEASRRHEVRKYIQNVPLLYNNGDPGMFNQASGAILDMLRLARERGVLRVPTETRAHRDIVTWPIKIVSGVQRDFLQQGQRLVGGKPHNLSVTPNGTYESDTGDGC